MYFSVYCPVSICVHYFVTISKFVLYIFVFIAVHCSPAFCVYYSTLSTSGYYLFITVHYHVFPINCTFVMPLSVFFSGEALNKKHEKVCRFNKQGGGWRSYIFVCTPHVCPPPNMFVPPLQDVHHIGREGSVTHFSSHRHMYRHTNRVMYRGRILPKKIS